MQCNTCIVVSTHNLVFLFEKDIEGLVSDNNGTRINTYMYMYNNAHAQRKDMITQG